MRPSSSLLKTPLSEKRWIESGPPNAERQKFFSMDAHARRHEALFQELIDSQA